MSPIVFFLVIEGLCREILEEKRTRATKGIKVGRTCFLINLLFVDDVLLFCDGTIRKAWKLKEILDGYSLATLMEINMQKSTMSCNRLEEEIKRQFHEIFPFTKVGL